MNKYFYHFTHIDNLDSILQNGLLCTNKKNKLEIGHYDIANKTIQGRRSEMEIICTGKCYGKVHDYVPFYFSTMNPMQLAIINQKKIDQPELIFLGLKTELIKTQELIFTDSSANRDIPPIFYNKYEDLKKLKWDIINSKKWHISEADKPFKMAEVLIKDFEFKYVDHIVVFNDHYKKKVDEILSDNSINPKPRITYQPVENKYFYFTKFFMKDRKDENLVTGPKTLIENFEWITSEIIKLRKKQKEFRFKTINDLLNALEEDFGCIKETKGILNLETINDVHSDTVSNHTLEVVKNLKGNKSFQQQPPKIKAILLLSAFLHDIGKGPHSKWSSGKQPAYNDHPNDSLFQAGRILLEDIQEINDDEIRLINLLIAYHDILGDLSRDFRNTIELKNVISSEQDLELLYILSQADILAIREDWYENLNANFANIKRKVLGL